MPVPSRGIFRAVLSKLHAILEFCARRPGAKTHGSRLGSGRRKSCVKLTHPCRIFARQVLIPTGLADLERVIDEIRGARGIGTRLADDAHAP